MAQVQQRQRPRRPNHQDENDQETQAQTTATTSSSSAAGSGPLNNTYNTAAGLPPTMSSQSYANLRSNCSQTLQRRRRNSSSSVWMKLVDAMGVLIALGLVLLVVILLWEVVIPTRQARIYYGVLAVSLIPVGVAAYTALRPQVFLHQRVTPVVLVATIVSGRFPTWLNAALAAVGLFLFGWMTRPLRGIHNNSTSTTTNSHEILVKKKSSDDELDGNAHPKIMDKDSDKEQEETKSLLEETSSKKPSDVASMSKQAQQNLNKTAVCVIILTIVMLTENFFIWVVSATFEKGWNPKTAPEPLQDNGRQVLHFVFTETLGMTKREVVSLRRLWNVQYALVAALGTALNIMDFHPTRQLWSLGCRTLLTLASARFLRTISFLLTVLPSQNKFCFAQHYPNPPPSEWWEWFLVGLKPNSHGGCNDLIVSGHATVTATVACVAISLAENPLFSVAVSSLLAMDYAVEIYEGFHYSVDMWMGAVLVGLLWKVWKPIEDNNTDRNTATLQDVVQRLGRDKLTVRDTIQYGAPVLLAFVQVTVLPEVMANFIIVCVLAAGVAQIVLHGFQQYTKHLFYCALYMTLGIYL